MNNKRRGVINNIKLLLNFENKAEETLYELEEVLYEEENSYYSIPENLLCSKRAETSEDAIDHLSNAIDILGSYIDNNKTQTKKWEKIKKDVLLELLKIC